jgi:hypothetical protein
MFTKTFLCASLLAVTATHAEESFLTQACKMIQNTGQITKLVILDTDKAGEATVVTVTISREIAEADEKWEKMLEFGKTVYGTPKVQDDTTVKFVFERRDMSADVWRNFLSAVEGIFVALRSTVEGYTNNTARVTVELN